MHHIRHRLAFGTFDGGYLCDIHEKPDKKPPKSCIIKLCWTPKQSPWKAGKEGEPNKWVTLYCLLSKKHAGM